MIRLFFTFLTLVTLAATTVTAQAQDSAAAPNVIAPLLDVLEDDAARAALLEALRGSEEAAAETPAADGILAVQVAEQLGTLARETWEQVGQSLRDVGRLTLLPDLLTEERMTSIRTEAPALAFTVILTVMVYRAGRYVSRRLLASDSPSPARAGVFFAQVILRALSVVFAVAAGFVASPLIYGGDGIATPQTLYLFAFAAVGAFTVCLSIMVSKYPEDVTFAGLSDRANTVIYKNTRLTAGVLLYGLMAAVPIAQLWVNFVFARSMRTTVVLVGAALAIWSIRRISTVIRNDMLASGPAPEASDDSFSDSVAQRSLSLWHRFWPVLGYGYVLVASVVALARPNVMAELVGRATLLTALAVVAILFAVRLFTLSTSATGLPLPGGLSKALPTLQMRSRTFTSPGLVIVGAGLLGAAGLLMLEGWQIVDVGGWLSGQGSTLLWRVASVLLILLALSVIWLLLASWIDKRLMTDDTNAQVSARSRTLLALFRNALSIAFVIFGGMTALSELGIDIAPLLAGAGVIGLAIGFGAQKLVQDIITGIFIQLENAINEGDVITVAGISGGVEKLSIRSVGIRDLSGVFHLIPFSAVDTVSNATRVFSYHVEMVGVAYDTNLDVAREAIERAFEKLKESEFGASIIAPMEFHGVVGLGDSSVNLRARIKTRPGEQWALGRAFTSLVKKELDAAGIEIPFPHRELKLPKELLAKLLPQGDKAPKPEASA